jgi:hypothetical protein
MGPERRRRDTGHRPAQRKLAVRTAACDSTDWAGWPAAGTPAERPCPRDPREPGRWSSQAFQMP